MGELIACGIVCFIVGTLFGIKTYSMMKGSITERVQELEKYISITVTQRYKDYNTAREMKSALDVLSRIEKDTIKRVQLEAKQKAARDKKNVRVVLPEEVEEEEVEEPKKKRSR